MQKKKQLPISPENLINKRIELLNIATKILPLPIDAKKVIESANLLERYILECHR